jgi:hypothetical protein
MYQSKFASPFTVRVDGITPPDCRFILHFSKPKQKQRTVHANVFIGGCWGSFMPTVRHAVACDRYTSLPNENSYIKAKPIGFSQQTHSRFGLDDRRATRFRQSAGGPIDLSESDRSISYANLANEEAQRYATFW